MKGNSGALSGNLIFSLKNLSKNENYTIEINDSTYKRKARSIVLEKSSAVVIETFDLSGSFNWYDIIVRVKGNKFFQKRYAGRIETGKHGKTDPFMGRI